ncbi:hypothetical protein OS965_04455 [Streptomyces sp. H27-G5]|uniref:hypothetical protein n=1 Tax=Streptomyces sp. H27-G5 TaxID=2996698 RepID=UPI002271FA40|nr:hypothetical protein [Streptomyces sp. H27-G5]MCY0917430.1 hypothetical protein [Streptomyces sp. H27-G5]
MTGRTASATLNRLRAVDWTGDWDFAFGNVKSRRVLFREYTRRAAVWAQAYAAVGGRPFFDVTSYVDPEFQPTPELAAELAEFLDRLPNGEVRQTCSGVVRMAELRARNPAAFSDLPDLYERLVLFYERGGEFIRDDAGFLDLTGVRFRPGTLESHLGNPPVTLLGDTVLDALDADGQVVYSTAEDRQGPLLRRRVLRDEQSDEVFGRDLRWESTDLIPDTEAEAKEAGPGRPGRAQGGQAHRGDRGRRHASLRGGPEISRSDVRGEADPSVRYPHDHRSPAQKHPPQTQTSTSVPLALW